MDLMHPFLHCSFKFTMLHYWTKVSTSKITEAILPLPKVQMHSPHHRVRRTGRIKNVTDQSDIRMTSHKKTLTRSSKKWKCALQNQALFCVVIALNTNEQVTVKSNCLRSCFLNFTTGQEILQQSSTPVKFTLAITVIMVYKSPNQEMCKICTQKRHTNYLKLQSIKSI